MAAFRIVDKRYPKPEPPPAPPRPRPVYCYERVANPNVHDSRRCSAEAGHEGMHAWEYCKAQYECYVTCWHGCELPIGHEGEHHATIEWD